MRNMSFSKTIPQMRDRTKTVTRRVGTWDNLKPGTLLCAVEKGQGLGKGEKVKRIGVIRVLSVRLEMLRRITADELVLEGFPGMETQAFFDLIGVSVPGLTIVNRIEFEHVGEEEQ